MSTCLAIAAALAGCAGGGDTNGLKQVETGQDSDAAPFPDSETAEDSDTARECEPVELEARAALAPAAPLCGGLYYGMAVTEGGGAIVAAETGTCDGVTEGAIYAVIPGADAPLWSVSTQDATEPLMIDTTRGGQGLVALERYGDDGLHGGAVEVRDSSTGELHSRIHRTDDDVDDGKIDILWNFAFADDRLVIGNLGQGGEPHQVAVFEPPWVASIAWPDAAVAVHPPPDGSCCTFGEVTRPVGDVTGDGLEDVVVMGGGSWVLDGATLTLDDGDAFPFEAGGYIDDEAISGVGDVDGDGIDDFSTSYVDEHYKTYVRVVQGGTLTELAEITDQRTDGYVGESVAGVGRIDGATTDSFAVVWSAELGMGQGGDEVWLVSGPLCGSFILEEVGTEVEVPSTSYVTATVGSDGWLVGVDSSDRAGYLFGPV